jgi:hypothetical protein
MSRIALSRKRVKLRKFLGIRPRLALLLVARRIPKSQQPPVDSEFQNTS